MNGFLAQSISDAFQAFDDALQQDRAMLAEAAHHSPVAEREGSRIGRYDLIERIGEGGFGTVWRAEQALPVHRTVALKIIKLGMDTCEVIARFEAERQALAVMDHPGIARVFDAGSTPTGRPYFVMELVRGEPITKHCANARLPLTERLALFIAVCHAVQHAHQKGIIHRDLKPSNLLVAKVDGKPVVKIIDFGIAKATGAERLTEHTLITHAGRLIGTPAYMSPEQAVVGMDIDTRSDVYSLGVVLYELLIGSTPFSSQEWLREFAEPSLASRTRDPLRPSVRLRSFSADRRAATASERQIDGPRLIGLVKGDLDWIVMKALERDRARRYDSANALAADLERHLLREPVTARPPTAGYLLRRYGQRNKVAVVAVAAIALALIAGTVVSTWMYLNERTARTQSQQVSQFLKKVLSQAGVERARGRDATMMREILDETAKSLTSELEGQPAVEAELRGVIATTYRNIAEYELSLPQSARALELMRQLHRGDHEDLAQALVNQGDALEYLGRIKEAEAVVREALAMRQRLFGEKDIRTASTHSLLAWILMKARRFAEAEPLAKLAVEAWRQHPREYGLRDAAKSLAAIYHLTNRHPESIAIFEEDLKSLREAYGPEHPDVMTALDNLGMEYTRVKRFDDAEPLLLEALRQGEKFYGPRYPQGYHSNAGLSRVAASRQQWDRQLEYARAALAAARIVYPAGHRYQKEGFDVVAGALLQQAERLADEAAKLAAQPEQAQGAAAKALAFLDEIVSTPELLASAKTPAWIECVRGALLRADPAKQAEAAALLEHGLETMKQKEKPTQEETKRIKKAEVWLARQ